MVACRSFGSAKTPIAVSVYAHTVTSGAKKTNSAEEANAGDALAIELIEPEAEEILVEDSDTAQIETEIILEDDATYIE